MSGLPDQITTRTDHIIGRAQQLEGLHTYLQTGDERQVVYYWAEGGLGKTRLLEELQALIDEENKARGGFYTTGIIDLYHTDTHSPSDIEKIIVESLDPENKYFIKYRDRRKHYENLRELGTDPLTLEERRKELAQFFIEGYRNMAVDARKVILCFDTIELLQYESSVVEEKAGLDTSDTRLKPWLLDKLSKLPRALIVFAGRPKKAPPGESVNPQARLIEDMKEAFGDDLRIIDLNPLTLEETKDFIIALVGETDWQDVIPPEYLPVVHKLTGGRPIFLHLLVDLLWTLSVAPRDILNLFDDYDTLIDASEGDERLREARRTIEARILNAIFNQTGVWGEYLKRLALLPKGVDKEILYASLGMPEDEAETLLGELEALSFIKHFKPLPGSARFHPERTFLHDEFYRMLTSDVVAGWRIEERTVASALVRSYYNPRINRLQSQLLDQPPEKRPPVRERLQKLQVERLYYTLASNVREGYAEYRRLSDEANRSRWVGFGMRLLDEFLRFYNDADRQEIFERAGLTGKRIIWDSAELWIERFYWWKQRRRAVAFGQKVFSSPADFHIVPPRHLAIWGNIHALWSLASSVRHGYDPEVVDRLHQALDMLPTLADCNDQQKIARARLANAIGYQLKLGGKLVPSIHWYEKAKAAYMAMDTPQDLELFTSLLNNLAFAYANQGRMALAHTIGKDALQINEETRNSYTMGLTFSTLSLIYLMQGNYDQANTYGVDALEHFENLEDAHGIALAHLDIAKAKRRMAKDDLAIRRKSKKADIERRLKKADHHLATALDVALDANLDSDIADIRAEYGRLYREWGRYLNIDQGLEEALPLYQAGEKHFQAVLDNDTLGAAIQADVWEDLGELLFLSHDEAGAKACITKAEAMIPKEFKIIPGEHIPEPGDVREYFSALAKLEMLKGQMAFDGQKCDRQAGLRHYILAYAYFRLFSREAVQTEQLIDYLYRRLRNLPYHHQKALISETESWLNETRIEVDLNSFLDNLHALLGV
jgi:tetratricopeptide (TPR) repeat protein